jgi:DNA-binding NarL/FixJ family response regulator
MISLLIVDDHPIVTEGLANMFKGSEQVSVIGIAGSSKACMDFLRWEKPDIILLDINLPDESGLDLCKKIKTNYPSIKILALSTFSEKYLIQQMMTNGASGYVLKNASPREITEGIEAVMRDEIFFSGGIEQILEKQKNKNLLLTRREIEVLKLLSEGLTNGEIAERLFISVLTVDSHRKNLITKLGAKNTAMLIKLAMDQGYI